jgi:hypothetical protein
MVSLNNEYMVKKLHAASKLVQETYYSNASPRTTISANTSPAGPPVMPMGAPFTPSSPANTATSNVFDIGLDWMN